MRGEGGSEGWSKARRVRHGGRVILCGNVESSCAFGAEACGVAGRGMFIQLWADGGLHLSWHPEALVGEDRVMRGRLRSPTERGKRRVSSTRESTTIHHPPPPLHLLPHFDQPLVRIAIRTRTSVMLNSPRSSISTFSLNQDRKVEIGDGVIGCGISRVVLEKPLISPPDPSRRK